MPTIHSTDPRTLALIPLQEHFNAENQLSRLKPNAEAGFRWVFHTEPDPLLRPDVHSRFVNALKNSENSEKVFDAIYRPGPHVKNGHSLDVCILPHIFPRIVTCIAAHSRGRVMNNGDI